MLKFRVSTVRPTSLLVSVIPVILIGSDRRCHDAGAVMIATNEISSLNGTVIVTDYWGRPNQFYDRLARCFIGILAIAIFGLLPDNCKIIALFSFSTMDGFLFFTFETTEKISRNFDLAINHFQ